MIGYNVKRLACLLARCYRGRTHHHSKHLCIFRDGVDYGKDIGSDGCTMNRRYYFLIRAMGISPWDVKEWHPGRHIQFPRRCQVCGRRMWPNRDDEKWVALMGQVGTADDEWFPRWREPQLGLVKCTGEGRDHIRYICIAHGDIKETVTDSLTACAVHLDMPTLTFRIRRSFSDARWWLRVAQRFIRVTIASYLWDE